MMGRKLNTKEFIDKSLNIHGNKYDYSKADYINSHIKIKIICKKHGEFLQIPNNHLNGSICLKCSIENQHDKQKKTKKEFIIKSKKVHGNKYNYSDAVYINACTKVKIICKKHGEFLQTPSNHYQNHGCPKCRSELISKLNLNRDYSKSILKMRKSAIKRIERERCNGNQLIPAFNPNACKIIDQYGKKNGYNFQHAMNGGEFYIKELGYFVDGYDKNKNIIIEIDEPRHFDIKGNLHKKDINRQKEIEEFLKCKFIRLKFKENK